MSSTQMVTVRGIGAAPGYATGRLYLLGDEEWEVPRRSIEAEQVGEEIGRFQAAIDASLEQIGAVLERLVDMGEEGVLIMQAHQMMLKDEMLVEQTRELIRRDRLAAESALDLVLRGLNQAFSRLTVLYFRERALDLKSVGSLIMSNLLGRIASPAAKVPPESIVVAYELTAAQAVALTLNRIRALVTEVGGITSHTAIMARAMEIPAVVGVTGICTVVRSGQQLAVDGNTGQVILNPDAQTIRRFRQDRIRHLTRQKQFLATAQGPAVTADGVAVEIQGNIEYVEEIESLLTHGGEGIGLFRTEYLLLHGSPLDEEAQLETYRRIIEEISPRSVTMRTLDAGGGKDSGRLALDAGAENPALGLRGIRWSLLERELLKVQLRALLRASVFGPLRILIPFVTGLRDVLAVKAILGEVKEALRGEGKAFDESVPLGVMIEVPSAAITADLLAREADFFSIGTNDLIQYTLAVDRNNQMVAQLYNPLNPAVLRLLSQVVLAADSAGLKVSICGELAGEPQNVPLLLGCGLTSLSMNPISIPRAKEVVRRCHHGDCRRLFGELMGLSSAVEITQRVQEYYRRIIPESA